MNFEKYHNKVEYPGSAFVAKIDRELEAKKEAFVGTVKEVENFLEQLKTEKTNRVNEQRNKYNRSYHDMIETFKKDAYTELGISEHPKRELLWNKVYNNSNTLEEIFMEMESLLELM